MKIRIPNFISAALITATSMAGRLGDNSAAAQSPDQQTPSQNLQRLFDVKKNENRNKAIQRRIQEAIEDDALKIIKEATKQPANEPLSKEAKAELEKMYSYGHVDPRKAILILYVNGHHESFGLKKFLSEKSDLSKTIISGLQKKYNIVLVESYIAKRKGENVLEINDPLKNALIKESGFALSLADKFSRNSDGTFVQLSQSLRDVDSAKSRDELERELMILSETPAEHHFDHTSFPAVFKFATDSGFMNYLKTIDPKICEKLKALTLPTRKLNENNPTRFANDSLLDSDDPNNKHIFKPFLNTDYEKLIIHGELGSFINLSQAPDGKAEEKNSGKTLRKFLDQVLEEWKRYQETTIDFEPAPKPGNSRDSIISNLS